MCAPLFVTYTLRRGRLRGLPCAPTDGQGEPLGEG